jgi:hypothetical protein
MTNQPSLLLAVKSPCPFHDVRVEPSCSTSQIQHPHPPTPCRNGDGAGSAWGTAHVPPGCRRGVPRQPGRTGHGRRGCRAKFRRVRHPLALTHISPCCTSVLVATIVWQIPRFLYLEQSAFEGVSQLSKGLSHLPYRWVADVASGPAAAVLGTKWPQAGECGSRSEALQVGGSRRGMRPVNLPTTLL